MFSRRRGSAASTAAFAVATAVLLTLPAASATAAHAGAASTARAGKCATSGLVVWLDTHGNGAAGSTYYSLEFTNLSGHRCTLFGYPGVSAVDLGGRQLGIAGSRDAHTPSRTVNLAAGKTASAVLQVTDPGVFPKTSCRPVTAAGLRVYPPNQTEPRVVPFPFSACSGSGPAYLHVEAVSTPAA
jgi:hypothetical protein